MKRGIFLLSLALLFTIWGTAAAVERVGTTALQVLKLNVGPRGAGMGMAMVAVTDEATSVFWNPAGLGWRTNRDVRLLHVNLPADVNYDAVCLAYPLPGEWGTVGVGFSLLHMDDMLVRTAENPDGAGEYFTAWDMVVTASYSMAVTDRFTFGGSVKYVRETVSMPDGWDNHVADAVSFDAGLQYLTGFRSLKLGMVVQNFGPRARFTGSFIDYRTSVGTGVEPEERSFNRWDQPLTFKAGVSADVATMSGYSLGADLAGRVSAQFEHPSDHEERVNMGLEMWFRETIALRGGYNINYDADRFTLGFGARLPWGGERTLCFDYAYADQGDLTDTSSFLNQPHRFGIGVEF